MNKLSTVPVRCAALLALCLLAACAQIPLGSLWQMRKLDLSTLDPAQLRAAVRTPESYAPRPRTMHLRVEIARQTAAGRESHQADAALEELDAAARGAEESDLLVAEKQRGARLTLYRIAAADVPALRALQQQALAWKSAGPGRNSLSISINPDFCRRTEAAVAAEFSTYLRFGADTGYVALLRDAPLSNLGSAASRMPRCE